MLSIATLFDDEQRLLNRVWIVLLGLEALLVLVGTISAVVRGVVAFRRRRPGGLRRAGSHHHGRPRRVTIELPATAFPDYEDRHTDVDGDRYDEKTGMDTFMDADMAMHAEHDIFYADERFHTPTRARTPTHIVNSPSRNV
ncbi:uncharacterized protein SPSK_02820 [Sporothrix schenckii 1099-18]|uniref:Uncharacterized protein n=2 Tax=Sporothrix schenckii TaxID=29908 RepID=U7PQA1_SPOS1|nr:uncharacterized protein SPSK_02820 [Sporothrix schenckii 1099-18]ERS97116.1 hypothetical protein HMPREF1624_06446 [Sporothrix schenckii ATCC 58251]KJR86327.1 hypothetical protein SPSK_02820 [Sporothrix schenckii 1099-18]